MTPLLSFRPGLLYHGKGITMTSWLTPTPTRGVLS